MPTKKGKKEFRRYSLVGFSATIIDYGLLNVLTHVLGYQLIASNLASASISSVFSYIFNRKVVFKDKAHSEKRTIFLYAGSLIIGVVIIQTSILFALDNGLLEGAFDALGVKGTWNDILASNVAKIIAGLGTYVWNFMTQRKFVFESHSAAHN